jgi:hypothetical protein
MKRTVSIPVDLPSDRFLPLMNQCAEIFNAHVDWAIANSTYARCFDRFSRSVTSPIPLWVGRLTEEMINSTFWS